jgi:hypothetical protein
MAALDDTVGICDLCGKEADARYEVRQGLTDDEQINLPTSSLSSC